MARSRKHEGIVAKHSRGCASRTGGPCNCKPTYQAWVWSARDRKKIYKSFPTLAAAKLWRSDAVPALRKGTMRAPTRQTVAEAWAEWLAAAEAGEILARTRRPYKPSTLRGYRDDMANYVLPEIGGLRLSEVRPDDMQAIVERLNGRGLSGSKTRNCVIPMQALYRRHRREVPLDPTEGLDLPAPGGRRERTASPAEAAELLAALPDGLRPIYATAFYAGMRRGELRALRWRNVHGVLADEPLRIDVSASWDDQAGEIEPKSLKGARTVECPEILRPYLEGRRLVTGRGGDDLVFGRTAREAFTPSHVRRSAAVAWETANLERKRDGLPPLNPIGLHECRHTYVSMMAAAGVPLERIGDSVGHASSYMTDRYRHLIEGQSRQDADRLDQYLNGEGQR